ncbi:uncharacterized protein [Embiotoca jacksoni]|uniref:uncharacterized protein n=1 Tax=Embiotoca jacksoni TaxID=100190 RepID=UPI0037045CC0
MAAEVGRREERLNPGEIFRNNAFIIITEMLELQNQTEKDTTMLVDEILHSILFLGKIHDPPFSPLAIFDDDEEMLNVLKGDYPRPFALYSSQIPRRSPFSCVLDMMVHVSGQDNEEGIKNRLQEFTNQLKKGANSQLLFCSTMCVSHINEPNSVRYYGVSMSNAGRKSGRILVNAACCSAWDDYVAGAVMTFYPKRAKRPNFDGTIRLPEGVTCQAFGLSDGREKPPCRSCATLFGFQTTATESWANGNCAEVESLSNLFKNENHIKEQARPLSETWTEGARQTVKEEVLRDLKNLLKAVKFEWENNFYTPQIN